MRLLALTKRNSQNILKVVRGRAEGHAKIALQIFCNLVSDQSEATCMQWWWWGRFEGHATALLAQLYSTVGSIQLFVQSYSTVYPRLLSIIPGLLVSFLDALTSSTNRFEHHGSLTHPTSNPTSNTRSDPTSDLTSDIPSNIRLSGLFIHPRSTM